MTSSKEVFPGTLLHNPQRGGGVVTPQEDTSPSPGDAVGGSLQRLSEEPSLSSRQDRVPQSPRGIRTEPSPWLTMLSKQRTFQERLSDSAEEEAKLNPWD